MVASTKVSQIRAVPSGSANPRVNSDDPLISKERWARVVADGPEDEREAEGDREHPDQGQADQRHRGVEGAEVGPAVLVAPLVDEDPVGHARRRTGRCG